jgi:S1-C subfamily serine protease
VRGEGFPVSRIRLAGAAVVVLLLLTAPVGRAARGGHATVTQRPPGYLGIEFHDLTSDQAAALHLRDNRGVEVLLVDHDGPAASAGLQPHDLITGINGHIVPSGEALRRMIRETGAGVEVKLSVFRNGNPITIRTKLANREVVERKAWARLNQPEPQPQGTTGEEISGTYTSGAAPAPAAPAPHAQGFIDKMVHGSSDGLVVDAMQPQLASYFGVADGRGLLVQSVEDGSPAAVAGLHAGDVIVRADGQPMHSASEWTKHLHAAKGKAIALDVLRDHQRITLTLASEAKKR